MPVQFLLRSEGLPATIAFHLTGLLPFLILPLICHENHLPSLNCARLGYQRHRNPNAGHVPDFALEPCLSPPPSIGCTLH